MFVRRNLTRYLIRSVVSTEYSSSLECGLDKQTITPQPDPCTDAHKAANDTRNETTWKACDDTGLMGSCCRHDAAILLANIHGTGENRALPLIILKQIVDKLEPDRQVGILYDIGCSLDKFITLVCCSYPAVMFSHFLMCCVFL